MTKVNSTAHVHARKPHKAKKQDRPGKPHKDFPLTPHVNGLWCKKILGKLHYFGSWKDDRRGELALQRWLAEKDELLAGRVPRSRAPGAATLVDLVDRFLKEKRDLLESGERSPHTLTAHAGICRLLLEACFHLLNFFSLSFLSINPMMCMNRKQMQWLIM